MEMQQIFGPLTATTKIGWTQARTDLPPLGSYRLILEPSRTDAGVRVVVVRPMDPSAWFGADPVFQKRHLLYASMEQFWNDWIQEGGHNG